MGSCPDTDIDPNFLVMLSNQRSNTGSFRNLPPLLIHMSLFSNGLFLVFVVCLFLLCS